jgi:hypothetical protein
MTMLRVVTIALTVAVAIPAATSPHAMACGAVQAANAGNKLRPVLTHCMPPEFKVRLPRKRSPQAGEDPRSSASAATEASDRAN